LQPPSLRQELILATMLEELRLHSVHSALRELHEVAALSLFPLLRLMGSQSASCFSFPACGGSPRTAAASPACPASRSREPAASLPPFRPSRILPPVRDDTEYEKRLAELEGREMALRAKDQSAEAETAQAKRSCSRRRRLWKRRRGRGCLEESLGE
jgi:hypothetical protein